MIQGRLMKNKDQLSIPTGCWTNAKNVLYHKGFKTIKNEDGAVLLDVVAHNYTIIGRITTPDALVIFSTNNTNSQITVMRNGVETIIVHDSQHLFNFNMRNAIEGVYKYNNKGELIVAWCDGIDTLSNTPYILNIDNLPFVVNANKELVNPLDINKALLFPLAKYPVMETSLTYGGQCQQGAYWFTVRYLINDWDTINTVGLSEKVSVWKTGNETLLPVSFAGTYNLGNVTYQDGDYTSKVYNSVNIAFSNLDTRFDFFELYVMHYNNNQLNAYKAAKLSTSISNYVFNGIFGDLVNTNELLIPTMRVDKAETMTVCDNRLHLGDIINKASYNYQKYANNIKVEYDLVASPTHPRTPDNAQESTLMPFEVYALYAHIIWLDGSISEGFHIPGRVARPIDTNWKGAFPVPPVTPYMETELVGTLYTDLNARAEENSYAPDAKLFHTRDTADLYSGALGYWENQNEQYPDNDKFDVYTVDGYGNPVSAGNIRGDKVRHHRMPSAASMVGAYGSNPFDLRIRLNFSDIPVPADLAPLIQGFCFSFAKRENDNKTILGEVIPFMYKMEDAAPTNTSRWTTSQELMSSHESLSNIMLIKHIRHRYTGYACESFGSGLGRYIRNEVQSYLNSYGVLNSDFMDTELANVDGGIHQHNLLSEMKYLPANVTTSYAWESNAAREGTLFVNMFGSAYGTEQKLINPGIVNITNDFYSSLIVRKNVDVYMNFYTQDLSMHPSVLLTNAVGLHTHNIQGYFDAQQNKNYQSFSFNDTGTFMVHGLSYYSFDNILSTQRQKPSTLTWTSYIDTYAATRSTDVNPFTLDGIYASPFDFSLNKLSDMLEIGANNPLVTISAHRPYIVMRSAIFTTEGYRENWRTFAANDYFESIFNRGSVVGLQSSGKTLFIQYRYSLYVAAVKDSLKTDNVTAYLGIGDIFDRFPEEVLSSDNGTVSCESKFECKYTQMGLVTVDRIHNTVWLLSSSGVVEIGKMDMFDYFEQRLNKFITDTIKNPYIFNGIHIGCDKDNERILITKLGYELSDPTKYTYGGEVPAGTDPNIIFYDDGNFVYFDPKYKFIPITKDFYYDRSFTLSFVPTKGWISFHNYKPNAYSFNRDGMYGLLNTAAGLIGQTFKHVRTAKGKYYTRYEGIRTFSAYIDFMLNAGTPTRWQNIEWAADVLDLDSNYTNKFYNETFTHIAVYNDRQCTNLVVLEGEYLRQMRNINENWKFKNFRDYVMDKLAPYIDIDGEFITSNIANDVTRRKNFFEKSKFFSKFVAIRLLYDNVNQREIVLNEVTSNNLPTR